MAKISKPPARAEGYDPVEAGFLDARGKLIEVAAFLDRVERHKRDDDYRVRALKVALIKLSQPETPAERAKSVLRAFSDPTTELAEKAGASAAGAWQPEKPAASKKRKAPKTAGRR
jgi:hypothetical protein